ncbi:hypothetical protein BDW22DRAFT_452279 [Trametopsis cervina]|nr:hypothetical protein BDW22DRAFT_452279 [Trametopsis cervina]
MDLSRCEMSLHASALPSTDALCLPSSSSLATDPRPDPHTVHSELPASDASIAPIARSPGSCSVTLSPRQPPRSHTQPNSAPSPGPSPTLLSPAPAIGRSTSGVPISPAASHLSARPRPPCPIRPIIPTPRRPPVIAQIDRPYSPACTHSYRTHRNLPFAPPPSTSPSSRSPRPAASSFPSFALDASPVDLETWISASATPIITTTAAAPASTSVFTSLV